ncbi:MAG: Mu transposase C-terminal domain-containing protein [Cellvibrio sp.]|uniref:Mu transposase C-terminal domain-containing protein n=1 Tax=Cellvibrio sp. TaxID=1965322 RepID=UPI0031A037A5
MNDIEFEIQYVHNDHVRYSTVNGGKTHSLSITQYVSLLAEKVISIIHEAKLIIHENNIKKLARKMQYVKAVITCCGSYLKKEWVLNIIYKTAKDIEDSMPPSYHTVRKWIKAYQRYGQNKLVPVTRGNSYARFDGETDMIIAEEIENARQNGFKLIGVEVHAHVVHRLLSLAQERGVSNIKIPSLRLIQRRISALDFYHRLMAEHGKERANRLIRASGKKVVVPCPMAVVQIDTHFADVIIVDPDTLQPLGRPYIVLVTCIHTRRIVGHYISLFPPSATTTLQAVKRMLVEFGTSALIIPDRGVEFANSALFQLCNHLSISLEFSQVREPNHKANVESLFRTITLWVTQRMEGTTYSNVLARGDYQSEEKAIFTLCQFKNYIDTWINEIYNLRPHSQTKRPPLAMWEKSIATTPMLRLETEEIENLARVPALKTVHRGRVIIHNLSYYSHALTGFEGKKVVVLVDEMDLATVYVQDPTDARTLIQANSTEPHYTTGLTLNKHKLVGEELNALSKSEMTEIGEHKWQVGLSRLMNKIRDDALSNRKRKKALNGQSAADTTLYENTSQTDSALTMTPENEPTKRKKNQPKVSSTRTRAYIDKSESSLKTTEITEYEVIEL